MAKNVPKRRRGKGKVHQVRWKKTARLGKQEFAFTREGREGQQQERKLKERKLKRLVRS